MTEPNVPEGGPVRRRGPMEQPPIVAIHADDGATAQIYRHGAHVTSWCPASGGDDRLYLSSTSEFGDGTAIRGGIPIIFPQFGLEGPLPRHGFARTTTWGVGGIGRVSDGTAEAEFVLRSSDATKAIWDAEFTALATVCIAGNSLAVTLTIENVGEGPFSFAAALHTYLRVGTVRDVEIVGFRGAQYRVPGDRSLITDDADVVRVGEYLERVYVGAPNRIEMREGGRTMIIESEGFRDAVLWNPGSERAAAVPDIEPGGEQRFVCIEAAAVQEPIVLEPRRRWVGTQTLTAR